MRAIICSVEDKDHTHVVFLDLYIITAFRVAFPSYFLYKKPHTFNLFWTVVFFWSKILSQQKLFIRNLRVEFRSVGLADNLEMGMYVHIIIERIN